MNNHTVMRCVAIATSALCTMNSPAASASPGGFEVRLTTKPPRNELAPANASCVAASATSTAPGANRSLPVKWSQGPAGTKSYAVTMIDLDVPRDLSTLNQTEKTIAGNAPRMEFVHWVLADIPAERTALAEAEDGDGHLHGGLPLERTAYGVRGQNGFAAFMKDGPYGGYMGPCPPWNDARVHRYRVTVYALDVSRLPLSTAFTKAELLHAMTGHVLATASTEVEYSVNPSAKH
jgi:Raf kinase inhibitor-like YbhB/YbcL family protein